MFGFGWRLSDSLGHSNSRVVTEYHKLFRNFIPEFLIHILSVLASALLPFLDNFIYDRHFNIIIGLGD